MITRFNVSLGRWEIGHWFTSRLSQRQLWKHVAWQPDAFGWQDRLS